MRDIFADTEWLSAEQVDKHSAVGDPVARGQDAAPERLTAAQRRAGGATRVDRWKQVGQVFALAREGCDWLVPALPVRHPVSPLVCDPPGAEGFPGTWPRCAGGQLDGVA